MFPYRESTSCGTTVECSNELVGVRIGTNRYITILDGELREVIAMLIHLASAKGLFSTPKESTPTVATQSDLLDKIIVAAEDMIERLESCIADGNGELEDDRPAIADAKDAITQAKEVLFPVAGTITIYNLPTCDVCGDGFTLAEWNDRHDGHDPDCLVRLCEGYDGGCECDLVYHVHCCPDCAGED